MTAWPLPRAVRLRDVGPRDGLQAEQPLPVDDRVRLIRALADAGLRHIEVGSFVSPKAVPAMAGTAGVVERLGPLPGVTRTALVPNARGARDALAAGIDELTVTLSASEEYGRRNTRMTVAEALGQVEAICELAAGTPVDAVVSCAFGSPYEGDIAPAAVRAVGEEARRRGATAVTYADTTGMATPARIARLVEETGAEIGLHLHETRATGLVCAFAGLTLGVARFDTSVGGLGGSPFAAGAAGNVGTEDLVHLLDDLGVDTGVDLRALLRASALLAELLGRELPSAIARR
ncbi:MAG TPA: hydroxymethylglutaryl-CoA lyase, partial [Solirubrobacteraceae bacterium]|nr:hydroxymethylglutaryl-CoA lyase [Solirubrobacteraceae bacterium]